VEGLPETTIDGFTGFICNNNSIESYLKKIEMVLNDDQLRIKLAANAIEFAQKRFNKKNWEDSIIDHYNSILI
jgi:glycosyltransferase involved in cell wall biosynthesis